MQRIVAVFVGSMFLVTVLAAPALAADRPDTPSPAPAAASSAVVKYDFSAKAAGLDRIAPEPTTPTSGRAIKAPAATAARSPQSTGKSFWKTPWPWVIAAAAVVIVVVAANKEGGLGGY